jgi:hypothetical protein
MVKSDSRGPPPLPSAYSKLATQEACSCGSLIGPHSFFTRLARKLLFECTNASYRWLSLTFCRADRGPDRSPGLACGPLVITSVPLVLIAARAFGMVAIAARNAAEKAKPVISLYFDIT